MKIICSIFSFLIFSLILSAQNADSGKVIVKTPIAGYFLEKNFFPNNSSYKEIDTSLDNIEKYFPNNFPYSLGLANRKLFFKSSSEIGFRSGFESLDLFGYNRNEIKYYTTRTPYTEIFALFGQKKEQYARLLHTQNIMKQWNIALNMLRLRSEGFYNRQNCTDNNISLSSNFTSKNNRYSFLANGFISSIKTDENGGVSDDTIFESNLFVNKKLIPVNLLEVRTRRGNREFTATQFLNFGRKDTFIKTDSTFKKIIPRSSLSYSFHINDSWFVYDDKDPTSGFYQNIFYDSTKTLDSTHLTEFQNEISFNRLFSNDKLGGQTQKSSQGKFSISIKNQTVNVIEKFSDSLLNNFFTTALLHTSYFLLKTNYCFYGTNKNDFLLYAQGKLLPTKHSLLEINLKVSEIVPSYLYTRYSSNHFNWVTDFEKIFFVGGDIKYADHKYHFSIGGSLSEIENYTFLDISTSSAFPSPAITTIYPNQSGLMIYTASAGKNFHLKKLNFTNEITFQQFSGDIIHLPQLVTNHSLYYEDKWFSVKDGSAFGGKKAADVRVGFDITYFSSYYADAYLPALGVYYWQDKKQIGNYPYMDFFFNMKIKHARIFFKTEHVNSGLMGAYYLAPHYPAPDRSLKVGINWVFYD